MTEEEGKQICHALDEAMRPGAKFFSTDGKELSPEECERIRMDIIEMVNGTNTKNDGAYTKGRKIP
jgi:hypothetical protein